MSGWVNEWMSGWAGVWLMQVKTAVDQVPQTFAAAIASNTDLKSKCDR